MQAANSYGPLIDAFIRFALHDVPMPDGMDLQNEAVVEQFNSELKRVINQRPVVVLKNDDATVCYRRPSVPRDIETALYKGLKLVLGNGAPQLDSTTHTLTDLTNPPSCSKHDEDLQYLYATCEKVGLLRELMIEIVSNDIAYFRLDSSFFGTPHFNFTPLNLDECACENGAYNRLLSDRRYVLEEQVVQHIREAVADRSETVRVMSMGNGGSLQDWKLIGLLVKEGYSKIQWVMVDPDNDIERYMKPFRESLSKIKGVQIEILPYLDIKDVQEKGMHAVVAIDFAPHQDESLMASSKHLLPIGKFFLGFSQHDLVIAQDKTTFLHQDSHCKALSEDVERVVGEYKGEIKIACLGLDIIAAHAIASLQKVGATSIALTIVASEQKTKMDSAEYFKFLFPSLNIAIETVPASHVEESISKGYPYDFVLTMPLTADMMQKLGVASLEQTDVHQMGSSTTAYIFNHQLELFRWNRKK